MKVNATCKQDTQELTLVFDNEISLAEFFAVFNHGVIMDSLPNLDSAAIRNAVNLLNDGEDPEYYTSHENLSNNMREYYSK